MPKFRTIQTPKHGVARYEQRVKESLVGEFNRVEEENGRPTISNYSGSTWLKKERPKYSVYPHKLDYCDTCARLNEKIRAEQTTLNRIRQYGAAEEEDQTSIEGRIASLTKELETHKDVAQGSHKYYTDVTKRCKKDWEEIIQLEEKDDRTDEENEQLQTLKHNFTLTLSCDYQMQKLVPYWGKSPQPGSSYYLQKLSHDIYGVFDHRNEDCMLYVFDETAGPKNTDHSISYLIHYIHHSGHVPSWIKRVHIFLDNTGSTNKNAYFMSWAMEHVQQQYLEYLRVSFMIVGHTKFDVDRAFSATAKAYNSSDVFTTRELADIMSQSPSITSVVDNGKLVKPWRDKLSAKYSKLPGIRSLHDFITIRHPVTKKAMMSVRELCYTGAPHPTTLRVNDDSIVVSYDENDDYVMLNKTRALTSTKLASLKRMYESFIPRDQWLHFLKDT